MSLFLAATRARVTRQSFIAASLIGAILLGEPVRAQSALPVLTTAQVQQNDAAAQASTAPKTLHIVILEGDEALNNIRDRTAREPIVQIEDENHKPVAGALVLFSLNNGSSGAGATFANGLTSLSVTTGADGRATAHGLNSNQVAGAFAIAVVATLGLLSTRAEIHQTNVTSGPQSAQSNSGTAAREPGNAASTSTPASTSPTKARKFGTKRNWLIASAAAVAIVLVIIFATRSSTTQITAGAGHVGP